MGAGPRGGRGAPWLFAAGLAGLTGVAAGAFAAHGLSARLPPADLAVFETGVRYQMYHAPALLAAAWLAERGAGGAAAGWCFAAGILLFSGSLYALALGAPRATALITPVGGLAFLAGWALLAVAGWLRWRARLSAPPPR